MAASSRDDGPRRLNWWQQTSFPVPIVIVSGRWLIIARLRTSDAIPIDFDETHMRINKAQDIFCVGIDSVDQRMPGAAPKRRILTHQHGFDRLLNDVHLFPRDTRTGA